MQRTSNHLFDFKKNNKQLFFYTKLPIRKNKCWKLFQIMRNCCLIILSIHMLKFPISGCDNSSMTDVSSPQVEELVVFVVGVAHEVEVAEEEVKKVVEERRTQSRVARRIRCCAYSPGVIIFHRVF
jgi:hypothetical protein